MAQNYRKSILITGASGQLGTTLVQYLREYYKVVPSLDANNKALDITNKNELDIILSRLNPDYIINCAAFTDVDKNEVDKKHAYNVNVNGLKNIIALTNKNTKIVHISSDYIFDGRKKSYTEKDLPNPLSYYGKVKLESENILRSSNKKYLIFRSSVIYNDSHKNFYTWVYSSLLNNKKIRVVTDQVSNPTWAWSLSEVICKSLLNNLDGIFHYAGSDILSRYDFAVKIANIFSFNLNNITPIASSDLNQLALRPSISTLDSNKIKEMLNIEHPTMNYIINTFKDKINA